MFFGRSISDVGFSTREDGMILLLELKLGIGSFGVRQCIEISVEVLAVDVIVFRSADVLR